MTVEPVKQYSSLIPVGDDVKSRTKSWLPPTATVAVSAFVLPVQAEVSIGCAPVVVGGTGSQQ